MSPEQLPPPDSESPQEFILGPPADPNSPSEQFYEGAIRRIRIGVVLIGMVACTEAQLHYGGLRVAIGVFLGMVLSYWNFQSLVTAVTALAGRIVDKQEPASGTSIVVRFIVRIPLVALAGYAIFISSPGSLRGFLVGLCVPVAAILWEAGYETYAALRYRF